MADFGRPGSWTGQHKARRVMSTSSSGNGQLSTERWDRFVFWARRWYEWPGFVEFERGYKDEISANLSDARIAVQRDAPDWPELLKRAFGPPNNLTDWRDNDTFLKWAVRFPDLCRTSLLAIWNPRLQLEERIRGFLAVVPPEAVRGPLRLVSFLLMGASADAYPIYCATPIAAGCKLVGFPPVGGEPDRAAEYRHALRFFQRIRDEAEERGLHLATNLDAQSVTWCITMEEPPSDWSDADQHAFLAYRGRSRRTGHA
ncbi:MAG: hypothetical protein JOZ87_30740 [Chloroflexi bacterium]|nr:hypothetical protein [Chloroflexota bacterium]